jgi:hypothetical protein
MSQYIKPHTFNDKPSNLVPVQVNMDPFDDDPSPSQTPAEDLKEYYIGVGIFIGVFLLIFLIIVGAIIFRDGQCCQRRKPRLPMLVPQHLEVGDASDGSGATNASEPPAYAQDGRRESPVPPLPVVMWDRDVYDLSRSHPRGYPPQKPSTPLPAYMDGSDR